MIEAVGRCRRRRCRRRSAGRRHRGSTDGRRRGGGRGPAGPPNAAANPARRRVRAGRNATSQQASVGDGGRTNPRPAPTTIFRVPAGGGGHRPKPKALASGAHCGVEPRKERFRRADTTQKAPWINGPDLGGPIFGMTRSRQSAPKHTRSRDPSRVE